MKSNIDLTSNEMFSRKQFRNRALEPRFEGILTGNREERYLKNLCEQEVTGDYCDCCGKYLKTIPWDRTYGLCKKCMDYCDKHYSDKEKFPWGKEPDMRGRRGLNPLSWN